MTAVPGAGEEAGLVCRLAGAESRWLRLRDSVARTLGKRRFVHSLFVADEAVRMGRLFGGDPVSLALAGILHDGAKEWGRARLLEFGESARLIRDPAERENPHLLHGPAGAWLARHTWGVEEPAILEAIRLHTAGDAAMCMEACIVFMADLIEPGRSYAGVEILRRLCREDLRKAMIEAIAQTLVYLRKENLPLHGGTLRCLAWLKKEREGQDGE